MAAALPEPLVHGLRRSKVVWVRPAGQDVDRVVWHLWWQDACYLLVDGGEQQLPGLVDGATARVSVRHPHDGRLLGRWTAAVHRVPADGPQWSEVAARLRAARLNLPDGEDPLPRWAVAGRLLRLVPTQLEPPAGGST